MREDRSVPPEVNRQSAAPRSGAPERWTIEQLVHALAGHLADIHVNAGLLVQRQLVLPAGDPYLHEIERKTQHLAILARAWAVLQESAAGRRRECVLPETLLRLAARPYRATSGISWPASLFPLSPAICDQIWVSELALRVPIHIAAQQGQELALNVDHDNGQALFRYHGRGQVQQPLIEGECRLLWEAAQMVMARQGGRLVLVLDSAGEEWRAALILPLAGDSTASPAAP